MQKVSSRQVPPFFEGVIYKNLTLKVPNKADHKITLQNFLRTACPWTSKIILFASGHSQLKLMNFPKINFISLVFLCFSATFLNLSSSSPKLT